MAVTVITPPAAEPVTLGEILDHLRIDHNDENHLIEPWITTAREYCEGHQRRAYITQELELTMDAFPAVGEPIVLPKPPLQSVMSVTYIDTNSVEATWPADNYLVDTRSLRGRIVPRHGKAWPTVTLQPINGVVVRYTAGYGAAEAVPERVKQAIKLLVGHWYSNREAVRAAAGRGEKMPIPFGVDALLAGGRVPSRG